MTKETKSYTGSAFCPDCGKPYVYVGDVIEGQEPDICKCRNQEKIYQPYSVPIMQGWVCPKCGQGMSPYANSCPCNMRIGL